MSGCAQRWLAGCWSPHGLLPAPAVLVAAKAHAFPLPSAPVLACLQKKGWGCRKEDLNELRAFKRRILSYPSCSELLFDEFLRPGLLIKD